MDENENREDLYMVKDYEGEFPSGVSGEYSEDSPEEGRTELSNKIVEKPRGKRKSRKKKKGKLHSLKMSEADDELSVEERQNKRKAKRRMRRIRFLIIVLTILLTGAACGGLYFLDKKGYANVETISIIGNSHYGISELLETSGATTGAGLIPLKTGPMKDKLKELPYIKAVKITKIPLHTLKIRVTERIAEYSFYFGGGYVYVDDEFVILQKSNDSGGLPVIEGFVPKDDKLGEVFVPRDETHFELAIKLAKALKEKGLNFVKVSYKNALMRIYFTKNMVCEGSYDNLMKYIDELNEIIYSLNSQGIERATIYIGDNGYISFSPKIE